MARWIGLWAACAMAAFVLATPSLAEDRIDCFEACDTKMMGCLNKCPKNPDGDFERDCRNTCAIDTFHPCLDQCPHPRTGLTPAQKREMKKLEQEQKAAPKS